MAQYWILKTEPTSYAYADLERDRATRWDGVTNRQALNHIRSMQKGDRVLIYHTGKEKAVVGEATVTTAPYDDPHAVVAGLAVVDLAPAGALPSPVPLSSIKADRHFADMALVRQGRLSVVPATRAQWERIRKMGGVE
ncbi:MAG: ubiquinol-cytochrome C reductase [Gemmatimonas sp. SG8_28]|nr:MAG: ubiquinol-cytochrome C reductase [Gemmatimonas sp. SG8_28]